MGFGAEGKVGISKELMKGSLRNGTTYGGDWKLSAAAGADPLGVNAEKSLTTENAAIAGNFFIFDSKADLNKYTQRVNLLDLNFYFGIGGSLKVFINIGQGRGAFPSIPETYEMRVDNTYVHPNYRY